MEAQDHTVALSPDAGLVLGPAVVRGVMQGALLVDIEGTLHRAQMALAYPYRPEMGDIVLILGQDDRMYVTGVLDGQGLTRMDFPGDLELRAQGRVRIAAKEGVDLDSESVTIRANRLDMVAEAVKQQFGSVLQRVAGTLRTMAGRQRTTVEESSSLHAKKIVRKAEGDVVVDGKQIKLG